MAQGEKVEKGNSIATGLQAMLGSTFLVYALLFGTGYFLYGQWPAFLASVVVAAISGGWLVTLWPKLQMDS